MGVESFSEPGETITSSHRHRRHMLDAYFFVQLSRLALELSTETAVAAAGAKLVSLARGGVGLLSLQM